MEEISIEALRPYHTVVPPTVLTHLVLTGVLEEGAEPLLLEGKDRLPEVVGVFLRTRSRQLVAARGLVVPELVQRLARPTDDQVQRISQSLLSDLVPSASFRYRLPIL